MTTVEDFLKTATSEQKETLCRLAEVADQENNAIQAYNRKVEPHQRIAEGADEMRDGQYAKIIREDAGDFALMATVQERRQIKDAKDEMKGLLIKAVKEQGMGHLGIIQRQYEHYVGEPIPK